VNVKAWISIHMPFVWRTRVPLYVLIAVVASAWFAHAARAMVTTTTEALTLFGMEMIARGWTFVTIGFVALFCFDVARRTAPVFVMGQRVRFYLCVAVSLVAIQLPQTVYLRTIIPRTAQLETEPAIDVLLKRHRMYGFWRCLPAPIEVPARLAEDLRRDLLRYGFHTHLRIRQVPAWRYCADRPDFQANPSLRAWSLLAWPLTAREPHDREFRIAAEEDTSSFEGRLESIKAAHQAMHGQGPLAAAMDIRRPLVIALIAAMLTTLFVSMPLVRARALANRRRLTVPRLGRMRVPYDEWIARRWPPLWVSRVAVAPLSMLFAPLVLSWIARGGNESTTLVNFSLLALAVLLLLATQRGARYMSGTTRQETVVLLVHVATLLTMVVLSHVLLNAYNKTAWNDWNNFDSLEVAMATIFFAACLQAARIGSIYTAFGAVGLTYVSMIMSTALVKSTDVAELGVAWTASWATVAILIACARTLRLRPTLQRVLLGALFLHAAVFGFILSMKLLMPVIPRESIPYVAPAGLLLSSICGFILILRITENTRRSLAHSPN
jgi:hypothetical protein